MSTIYKLTFITVTFLSATMMGFSQQIFKGKIVDANTKEPIAGASVRCSSNTCSCGCASNASGEFELKPKERCCTSFSVSFIGYRSEIVQPAQVSILVSLQQDNSPMQSVVVTANRESLKRSLAPIAISAISSKMIQDAKPASIDQLLNKVSGVYMVNLGNEQHSMSIRQPMTTKSLFLYLEDGIPIRTTGLFNHNALLEINMASIKNIEVIKGPSSSLYGSEAIGGVVNFITSAPPATPLAKISLQASNIGYRRTDLQTGFSKGKWGFALSGYYASKRNSYIEFSDFYKATFTARVDYRFSDKTTFSNSFTMLNYYSDMSGGVDSNMYVNKSFRSLYTFNYREVNAKRYRSTLNHKWNDNSKTSVSLIYRNNSIGQNPAYGIKDDYRRGTNGGWAGEKELAHGEINEAKFESYALIMQHKQSINWKKAIVISGLSTDISPSAYLARYIRISKDSTTKKYNDYEASDSILTNYKNNINNYAAFANFEFNPTEKLRVVASLRYDLFRYNFNNYLKPSSYSGSPDTLNSFQRLSPKVGITYNFSESAGVYANYSEGFVPPQVTEMYKGVKVPELQPSVFYNYEIGGWLQLYKGKLSADLSLYKMDGTNEIISVKMNDGSLQNMNAGNTSHLGIEVGINATPLQSVSIRLTAALSKHKFNQFTEKGTSYSGKEMNGAPNWMHNAEIWYKPDFLKGFRIGIEWQKIGSYYMDPLNTVKYEGYSVFHLRLGYKWKAVEIWTTVVNVLDNYYAYTSSKSNYSYSYTPGEPINLNLGIAYDFGDLFKSTKH